MNTREVIDNKYVVLSYINAGGMGTVLRVENKCLAERFALKYCSNNDAESLSAFTQEFQIMTNVVHENIMPVLDGNISHSPPYLVMPEAKHSIRGLFPQMKGNLTLVLKYFFPVCSGISFLHENGYCHCDINPSNILILNDDKVVISDFGLSRNMNAAQDGFIKGIPGYEAPEQRNKNQSDCRTDVYQLGKLFCEFYTGHFTSTVQIIGHMSDFNTFITRAIAFDPNKRYQTVAELTQALKAISNHNPKVMALFNAI